MTDPSKALTLSQQANRLIELCKLVDRRKPKETDLAELRRIVRDHPELWPVINDVSRQTEYQLIDNLGLSNSEREAMAAGLDRLRQDLGYLTAPALERMLIDQVALGWVRLLVLEVKHNDNTSQTIGIPQADFWDRTLSAAQRRYLRAAETLARVRRLLRPAAVQVNIGAQQLNVAGNLDSAPKT